jgi:hypothetical protein
LLASVLSFSFWLLLLVLRLYLLLFSVLSQVLLATFVLLPNVFGNFQIQSQKEVDIEELRGPNCYGKLMLLVVLLWWGKGFLTLDRKLAALMTTWELPVEAEHVMVGFEPIDLILLLGS